MANFIGIARARSCVLYVLDAWAIWTDIHKYTKFQATDWPTGYSNPTSSNSSNSSNWANALYTLTLRGHSFLKSNSIPESMCTRHGAVLGIILFFFACADINIWYIHNRCYEWSIYSAFHLTHLFINVRVRGRARVEKHKSIDIHLLSSGISCANQITVGLATLAQKVKSLVISLTFDFNFH